MQLVITSYLDRSPAHVRRHLGAHIDPAIQAAADRVHEPARSAATSVDADRAVVHGGLDVLDGAAIDWDGDDDLTTVRVTVPWTPAASSTGRQILAANHFAQVLSAAVRNAA